MNPKLPRPRHATASLPLLVGFGAVAALVLGFGVWAATAQIDGAIIASGRIILDRNRQAVQHLDGGVIEAVLVKEGDVVAQGDVLARLDPTLARSELSIVESRLFELMARRGRLEAERDNATSITFDPVLLEAAAGDPAVKSLVEGQERLFEARRDSLFQQVTQLENQQLQLENQIIGVDAQKAALDRQIVLIGTETEAQETLLERGLAQSSRVLNLQREDARLAGMMGEMTARRAQAMERISEIKIQALQLYTQRREEAIAVLRDLQLNELETVERRNALQTQLKRMEIRAPVAGVVYDLRLFGAQSIVRPADPLLFLVPQDQPLAIEAQIDPISVNEVYMGQEVVLRFRSFDMRDAPDMFGKVTRVSPDAFTDTTTGASYYRVEVVLPEAELSKLAQGMAIIPGMPVDAFIRTGEHTPLAYLAAPLMRYFDTALRDDS